MLLLELDALGYLLGLATSILGLEWAYFALTPMGYVLLATSYGVFKLATRVAG